MKKQISRGAAENHSFHYSQFYILNSCRDADSTSRFTGFTAPRSGLWYWARRRFTLAGLCVAGGFIVAGAVGADIENTVTYQSFALLLAFLLLALAGSLFFRAKFSATRSLPRFGTAGQPLHYRVRVKNLTAKTQAGLTLLEELADPRPAFQEWLAFQLAESRRVRPFRMAQRRRKNPFRLANVKEAEVPPLPPGGEAEAQVEVLPLRRGNLAFHRRDAGAARPAGIVPLVRRDCRAADAF